MDFLKELGIGKINPGAFTGTRWIESDGGEMLDIHSPVDGKLIASVVQATEGDYETVAAAARNAFIAWRQVSAPRRGEAVRLIGEKLRQFKTPLGQLVSYEMGKSVQEGYGEVQEMIDICDLAVGQSRQLYGFTMHSERVAHRMYDQYHPIGPVGVITAFNFPVAPWAWNAMIAAVCGDPVLWKPSSKTPLSAIAVMNILAAVIRSEKLPEGLFSLVVGKGATVGERLVNDRRLPLVSITGSTAVGREAAQKIAGRFGKTILELGGNNAIIATANADLKLVIPATVFGAVGTAGQRCTTTRRLIVHASIFETVKESLVRAYRALKIGSPMDEANHVGPLIDPGAVAAFKDALGRVETEGGRILTGGEVLAGEAFASGCYVRPAVVEATNDMAVVQEETFAPILYLIRYDGPVETAIAIQNDVVQGLSSAIFTTDLREAETFLSHQGSDCGLANVNIGTSGAEIGGAFGGEKETGGGRESGSDAWKAYMRRQTNTINYSRELPLAQGIKFDI
jgi:L-aminoadipate-semialdehyde dehydrogenase